jgi:type II secretory pathway pseudopilin PulG
MKASSSTRNGFALLMVILLLALLSGALASARMTLRAGTDRQTRLTLHAALLESAWAALRNGMKAGSSPSEYQVFEEQLPSGIHTRTSLQGLPREALPPPLQRADLPIFGQVFSLTAKAEAGNKTGAARALACRLPSGTVRILAWVETP